MAIHVLAADGRRTAAATSARAASLAGGDTSVPRAERAERVVSARDGASSNEIELSAGDAISS